ncbi:unnamed protein product [Closterium sp. NIES-53]
MLHAPPAWAPAALPALPARTPAAARCPLMSTLPCTLHSRALPRPSLLALLSGYCCSAAFACCSCVAAATATAAIVVARATSIAATAASFAASATALTALATTTAAVTAAMVTPTVLTFDAEGHPIDFESWLEDLHWYLQSVTREDVSLFEHPSGSLGAPAASADRVARSKWTSRDATVALSVRSHLLLDQRTHFRQLKMAKALYDAVVKRYSSPSSATVGCQALPFLFPELSDFTTVADLLTPLRSLHTRYQAALEPDFLAENKPPMYLTIYFLTIRLPDSLRAVRDHFLAGRGPRSGRTWQ